MAKQKLKAQSVEPNIADLANGWLKNYGLDYKLEQESLSPEIDDALNNYFSKNGGKGGNRPDAKLLLKDKNLAFYPVLIEYKGYQNRLVKLDADGKVSNKTAQNEPDFKAINSYAVNGAAHYANAILHYTSYTGVIAIGMTGYKDETGKLRYEIGVYYVSQKNFGIGQKVGEYTDFSFLKDVHFDYFIGKVKQLQLTPEEIERIRERRDLELGQSLMELNNDIYHNENVSERDRVYLVAASIIATLGVPGKVSPLEKSKLKSSSESGNRDGDIVLRKIKAFLEQKNLPQSKREMIIRTLQNTLTDDNINKIENGESRLKRIFVKIFDKLGVYYKIGQTTDFTGKLFNEMYTWLGYSRDQFNDVVLTPSYVATLLSRLARVNQDSYVWDFAAGSAGLLVAAMNEMLKDAAEKVKSPEELAIKSAAIKANQLLGLEILPEIYMLAVLNMILMGDGSSQILNRDSLQEFDGVYASGGTDQKFPADAFLLNPPYSAPGNGMIFVEKALSMMNKGYAAIIIQSSAGSGKAVEYNKKILSRNTLLSSVKMPIDLFLGRSNVQTYIYVFRVGEAHHKDDIVKFIDFSNDGYKRTNRKKAKRNLYDIDRAKERYDELVDLVRFGKSKLNIFTETEYYEGHIDPENGADWNQAAPVDATPALEDFKKTVRDYLAWEVSNLLKNQTEDERLGKMTAPLDERLGRVKWGEFKLIDVFDVKNTKSVLSSDIVENSGTTPYLCASAENNAVNSYIEYDKNFLEKGDCVFIGGKTFAVSYQEKDFFSNDSHNLALYLKSGRKSRAIYLSMAACIYKSLSHKYSWGDSVSHAKIQHDTIVLPITSSGEIDFDFMESFIAEVEAERIEKLSAYLKASGLDNYELSAEEENALENYNALEWGVYNLKALFGKSTRGKRLKSEDRIPGALPFVTAGEAEEGVSAFIGNAVEIFEKNTITIDMFGSAKYRNYQYGADDHIAVAHTETLPMNASIFVTSAIHKAAHTGKFDYGRNFYAKDADALDIVLPVKDGKPDYQAMETLISAVRKLVIKDVVRYADAKIKAAREVATRRRLSDGEETREIK